ncbi:MAG: DNA mismatch repair protein MutS [Methylococcaceae bacterium]|nr:DNA mismatch repair protein MutS [Methylococcaceae bacterium]
MRTLLNSLYPSILQSDSHSPPAVPSAVASGEGVIDETSFRTIEVDKLFEAVDHTATRIGRAVLYRSLARPLAEPALIRAKQEAVREIESDGALRSGLEKLLQDAAKLEGDFYDLLYAQFLGAMGRPAHELEIEGFGYESYRKGTRFMLNLVSEAEALPAPKSEYLRTLLEDLRGFAKSRAYSLMKGPAYRSEQAILSAQEKRWYVPAIKFSPSLFKPWAIGLGALLFFLALEFVPMLMEIAASIAPTFWLFLLPLGLLYIPVVGGFDRDACIYPLREIFKRSDEVQVALDSLGGIDELLAFIHYREAFGHPVSLPQMIESNHHSLKLKGVRNPILAKANPAYVDNDLSLDEERLAFVTGPNSGGKTAFCKTLAQTQLLAQIGCYVPAQEAQLSVADRIYYQTPEISHLADGEGRFGTELKRTKEMFMASTAHSLVIMDELSEGTTHEEKIEISTDILNGFRSKGCTTLLITHNHELVEHFRKQNIGLARQAEFRDDNPTYHLIEGISRISHADRVAKKIGFSRDDIARMLKGGGA